MSYSEYWKTEMMEGTKIWMTATMDPRNKMQPPQER